MCDMVAKRLYDAGYEVDTCYDGEEAFESVLTENYDLIVGSESARYGWNGDLKGTQTEK